MNAANLCPSFRAVTDSVEHFTADIDQDCSFNNRAKYSRLLERCRSRIASQLNVSADEIALVRNTSEANNMINNGLPLEAGDEVLLWDQIIPPTTWPGMCAPSASDFPSRGSVPRPRPRASRSCGGFTREFGPNTGCWRSRRFPMSAVSAYLSPNWSQQHMIAEFTFMWTALSPGSAESEILRPWVSIRSARVRTSGTWDQERLDCSSSNQSTSRKSGQALSPPDGAVTAKPI